jgi:hypothetical protein
LNTAVNGAWQLISFSIDRSDTGLKPWGENISGLLIYLQNGYMSVSINKTVATTGNPEKDILDSILFYSGRYQVAGDLITHQVTNASNPNRIGKEMVRFATFSGDDLILTTPKESYGIATLVWRRCK